jgi:hypothetical protein
MVARQCFQSRDRSRHKGIQLTRIRYGGLLISQLGCQPRTFAAAPGHELYAPDLAVTGLSVDESFSRSLARTVRRFAATGTVP